MLFRIQGGKAQYSIDEGVTWENFSSGAVFIGTYSANTSIDVSAYGASSASQFLAVMKDSPWNAFVNWQHGSVANYWENAWGGVTAPTITLNGNILTLTVGSVSVSMSGSAGSSSVGTRNIDCDLYYIGDAS